MDLHISLVCEKCKNIVYIKKINPIIICPKCNDGRLNLENCLTDRYIKSKKFKTTSPTAWKYLYNLIPFNSERYNKIDYDDPVFRSIVSLNEGGTPLRISNIGPKFKLKNLRIKDETRNPTTSYMDRGTSAEISLYKWLGSSTRSKNIIAGNVVGRLAVSLAAYSARAGFECELFVQNNQEWGLSPNILYQLISYGTKINLNSKKNVMSSNYYMFNYNNTFFVEGLKSIGFEICDQLGWELPDHIIVPMGQGTFVYAIYRSLMELTSLGLLKNSKSGKKVKIHGVTIEKNFLLHSEDFNYINSIVDPIKNKNNIDSNSNLQTTLEVNQKQIPTISPELIPPDRYSYLNYAELAIKNTGGSMVKVSDTDLINAVSLLASYDGILASPAGASSIAGLLKLIEDNIIDNYDDNIICIVTMGEGSIIDSTKNWKILKTYNKIMLQKNSFEKTNSVNNNVIHLGNTKTKILILLKEQSDYAYNLKKRIAKKYSFSLDLSTLYQHLNELERYGVIVRSKAESFRGKPMRLYYSITSVGKKLIQTK